MYKNISFFDLETAFTRYKLVASKQYVLRLKQSQTIITIGKCIDNGTEAKLQCLVSRQDTEDSRFRRATKL